MKLVIDRSKWRHGGNYSKELLDKYGRTELLNEKGMMCCLGFYSKAVGYSEEEIRNKPYPAAAVYQNNKKNLFPELVKTRDGRYYDEREIAKYLIKLNDHEDLSKEEREEKLKETFKEIDVDVEFVGEYPE